MSLDDYDTGAFADESVVLALVKTRLRVRDGELQRLNSEGGVLLRVPLAELESFEIRTVVDPLAIVFIGVGAALGALTYFLWEEITFGPAGSLVW